MAEPFATERSVITKHVRNIFQTNELEEKARLRYKPKLKIITRPVVFH